MEKSLKNTNNLINEKSPYLLQHAYNPVDWHAWNDEAFAKAKKESKPVFLSIGYSTCHWCHVMEHESFEHDDVAELMNDTFINIKVDREERPDIDHIYMNVCQMLTGSGGWPLTIIMTPDKKPFFAGTYFPKYSTQNRICMIDLVPKIKEIWANERANIYSSAEKITAELQKPLLEASHEQIDSTTIKKTYHELASRYDGIHGGFGSRPKFPTPHNLLFLMRYYKLYRSEEALEITLNTLRKMRNGGIYDHIGFGFHRYSTDKEWLLPHFEKMLYDQATLLRAYTEAWQITKEPEFKQTAQEIFEYTSRDLTAPEKAFYSAEDADSEGVEGKFYTWDINEFRAAAIGNTELALEYFNIQEKGNFRDEATYEFTGKNILHVKKNKLYFSQKYNLTIEELDEKIENIRQQLFDVRKDRIRPHLDDKILTDWNGLYISSLAYAGKVFGNKEMINAAEAAWNFIIEKMYQGKNLLHRYRENEAGIHAMLDDYAFLIWAALELYEATFNADYLQKAIELQESLNKAFWDEKYFGYFISSNKSEKLIAQMKDIFDSAIPTGNSVTFANLIKLWKITGNTKYRDNVEKMVKSYSARIVDSPSAFTHFMASYSIYSGNSPDIVIVADDNSKINEITEYLFSNYHPDLSVILKTQGIEEISEHTQDMTFGENGLSIYLCRNFACEQPVNNLESLKELMK